MMCICILKSYLCKQTDTSVICSIYIFDKIFSNCINSIFAYNEVCSAMVLGGSISHGSVYSTAEH